MNIIPWNKNNEPAALFWQKIKWRDQELTVGFTSLGLCFLGFNTPSHNAFLDLQSRYKIKLHEDRLNFNLIHSIESFLKGTQPCFNLHVKGTAFQINIWNKLLEIPAGSLTTYSQLGPTTQHARATGTAVGKNPVSIFIPCHRVIQTSGQWQQYYWGSNIKKTLLEKEGVSLK